MLVSPAESEHFAVLAAADVVGGETDGTAFLSSAAKIARTAETYSPETYVIDPVKLRQIIWEMQEKSEQEAG